MLRFLFFLPSPPSVSFSGEKRPRLAESALRLWPRSHLRTSGRLPCVSQRVETYAALLQVNTLVAVCLSAGDRRAP